MLNSVILCLYYDEKESDSFNDGEINYCFESFVSDWDSCREINVLKSILYPSLDSSSKLEVDKFLLGVLNQFI